MTTIPFDRPGNHIVLTIDGKQAIVDTGSQVTVADEPFEFLGELHVPLQEVAGLTVARLAHLAGFPCDILLGTDILRRHDVLFRWQRNEMVLGQRLAAAGRPEPITTIVGVPLFPATVNGRVGTAIFDTGAPLAYVAEDVVTGLRPIRVQRDFHPFVGEFTTPVYRIPTTVAGTTIDLDYGVATPPQLAAMMGAAGAHAIIGGALLENFDCLLSWRRNEITWIEPQVDRQDEVTCEAPRVTLAATRQVVGRTGVSP